MIKKALTSGFRFAKTPFLHQNPSLNSLIYTRNLSYFSTVNNSQAKTESTADTAEDLQNYQAQVLKAIEVRNQEITENSQAREFPPGALYAGIIATAPLVLGSLALTGFAASGMALAKLPTLFMSLVKYSGLHLSFVSGIHWGFALSEHDCSGDSQNSSNFARNYLILSTIPMILSFFLTGNLVYSFAATSMNFKFMNLAAMMGLHISLFFADVFMFRKKRIPQWYLRLKFGTTLATIISFTLMALLIGNHEEKLVKKNDPLRKDHVPSDIELLSGQIKG